MHAPDLVGNVLLSIVIAAAIAVVFFVVMG